MRFRIALLCAGALLATAAAAYPQARSNAALPRALLFTAREAFGTPLKEPSGAWYDARRREILVADTGNGRVVIFAEDGRPVGQFVHFVARGEGEPRRPGEPRRLAVNSAGEIFIVDNLCQEVSVCDFRGRVLRRISLGERLAAAAAREPRLAEIAAAEPELKPTAVAVDYSDQLYVASASRIFVFCPRGELRRVLGERGEGPGRFRAITSLWVDSAGRIYATDARSLGVQVLTPDGRVLHAFGQRDAGFTNFSLPVAVVTDRRGNLWVADALRHVASAFSLEERQPRFLGYVGAFGNGPGQLAYPSGLAVGNDRLVIVDRVGGRVQCFAF